MSVTSTKELKQMLEDSNRDFKLLLNEYKEQYDFSANTADPTPIINEFRIFNILSKKIEESKKELTKRVKYDETHWTKYLRTLPLKEQNEYVYLKGQDTITPGAERRELDYETRKQRVLWNITYSCLGAIGLSIIYSLYH